MRSCGNVDIEAGLGWDGRFVRLWAPLSLVFSGHLRTFDVHVTVHRDKFLKIKPTGCTNSSILFLEWNSTCFGQFLCPSSGVFQCTTVVYVIQICWQLRATVSKPA